MDATIQIKLERLLSILSEYKSLAVAFSGGVDSSLLAAAACKVLGERTVAMTARSATHPAEEAALAERMAREIGVRHLFFESREMGEPDFTRNSPDRCYYCKKIMFKTMHRLAAENGLQVLAHGANVDDQNDFRPGFKAARELGMKAPLIEAGLTKTDIRALAGKMGLSNADRPAMACLATRIPYGVEITSSRLQRISKAEAAIHRHGIHQCRVRDHGRLARIEVAPDDIAILCQAPVRKQLVEALRRLGYEHISLDLEGYLPGKMNRGLDVDQT